ncbi:hypothetical protein ACHAXS_009603 [Conticribra weissflogii]
MFDGSHRTNKREINLSGASASSRSSRAVHLNQARQQRLARAQAKAKLNAARLLQRCWRGVRAGGINTFGSMVRDDSSGNGDGISAVSAGCMLDDEDTRTRTSRGRKGIAMELDHWFQAIISNPILLDLETDSSTSTERQHLVSKATFILAFRLSPQLIPFYSANYVRTITSSTDCKKMDSDDEKAESLMRQDLLKLESLFARVRKTKCNDSIFSKNVITSTVAEKLTSVIMILLRRSFHSQTIAPTSALTTTDLDERIEQDNRLVNLINYMLEAQSSDNFGDNRLSEYFVNVLGKRSFDGSIVNGGTGISTNPMGGVTYSGTSARDELSWIGSTNEVWMVNLFLCFRDCFFLNNGLTSINAGSPGSGTGSRFRKMRDDMQGVLLKWCCCTILQLVISDESTSVALQPNHTSTSNDLPTYQRSLALLASIIFASRNTMVGNQLWMEVILNKFVSSLKLYLDISSNDVTNGSVDVSGTSNSSPNWVPLLVCSLSHATSRFLSSEVDFDTQQRFSESSLKNCSVLGPIRSFYFHSSCASKTCTSSASKVSNADSKSYRWIKAVLDTMASRECFILNHVLMRSNDLPKDHQQQMLFTYSIPAILSYTLQNQHGFAVMASFVARGDNIKSWFAAEIPGDKTSVALTTEAALAVVYEVEESEEESEDDIQESSGRYSQSQAQREAPSRRDNTTSGRFSRTDLQTLPKLDTLYQAHCLNAKKNAVDTLNKLSKGDPNKRKYTELMVDLAVTIGTGEWIYNLGRSLLSKEQPIQHSTMASDFFIPPPPFSPPSRELATIAYIGVLSSLLTTCSGIRAGRNAASPLLAKIAFHAQMLNHLWAYSTRQSSLFPFSSSSIDTRCAASAYEVLTAFCDTFSHHLLAVDDDEFLEKYASEVKRSPDQILAEKVVDFVKTILDDLYWVRPVLASDITMAQHVKQSTNRGSNLESFLRFQKARLILSGTKLWNSLYERWCRLYHVRQFCDEACWIFPRFSSRGQQDNNPIIRSQVTTLADDGDGDVLMEESSVASINSGDSSSFRVPDTNSNDSGLDALASSFRDPKMARVLTFIPQALPFSRRVNLFQSLLEADKLRTQDETAVFNQMMMNLQHNDGDNADSSGRERVTIHRDSLYNDSMKKLNRLGKKLRKKVQVTFVNQHGTTEAGIDGGGVFKGESFGLKVLSKYFFVALFDFNAPFSFFTTHILVEFLDDLIKDAFLPQSLKNDNVENSHYNGGQSILVDPQFCLPFLNKLLGRQNFLDDLKNLDQEFYKNLKSLRYMTADEIESLGLTFEMSRYATGTSSSRSADSIVELIPGGSSIPVTKENVIQYIHLVSHQRMNVSGGRQTHAFLRGFRDLVPAPWVRLFSAYEFQKLISGDDSVKGIDVKGMAAVMRYSGGFHPSQPIIHWLWEVVDEFTPQQQRKFLKFMTSCSRQPLLGFQSLVPAPCIQQVRLHEDYHGNDIVEGSAIGNIRLPTSSTCMNLLKLPKYPSKQMLKDKLLYAIESAAGFELS